MWTKTKTNFVFKNRKIYILLDLHSILYAVEYYLRDIYIYIFFNMFVWTNGQKLVKCLYCRNMWHVCMIGSYVVWHFFR